MADNTSLEQAFWTRILGQKYHAAWNRCNSSSRALGAIMSFE